MKLTDLSPVQFSDLAKACCAALTGTPWLGRAAWKDCVIVVTPGEPTTAMARSTFIGWARSHDLTTLANEALKRKVPRDHVLVFVTADEVDVSGAEFGAFPLYSAIREHWTDAA